MSDCAKRLLAAAHTVEGLTKLRLAYVFQPRCEQQRRLELIIALSAELVYISQHSFFATRLASHAIEAVIDGDWPLVIDIVRKLSFPELLADDVYTHTYAHAARERFTEFVELLEQAYHGRPRKDGGRNG